MLYRDDQYYTNYQVKQGDTLYKIAQEQNTNPNLLALLNGLNLNDYIYPDEMLLIPNNNYRYYITKKGDSLAGVAQMMNTTMSGLIQDNKTIYLLDGQLIIKKNN